jgi:hypothetical protein
MAGSGALARQILALRLLALGKGVLLGLTYGRGLHVTTFR